MKRKGIPIWEQHLERIVLLAAVLFFVVFGAIKILHSPNSVNDATHGKLRPSGIDERLLATANALSDRLRPESAASFEIPEPKPVLELFHETLATSVSPATALRPSHPEARFGTAAGEVRSDVTYIEPVLPAPRNAVAVQHFDAIVDEVVSEVPELQERFPESPYDVSFMTVAAIFSLADARAEFRREGESGEIPVPTSWYFNRLDVLDVKVEREELVDGEWTNQRVLAPLPAMYTLRDQLEEEVNARRRDEILALLQEPGAQQAILQPEFYALRNASWSPPDPDEDTGVDEAMLTEEERAILETKQKLVRDRSERDRMLEELESLGGSMPSGDEESQRPPDEPAPAGPPGRPGQSGGGRRQPTGKRGTAPGSGVGSPGGGGQTGGPGGTGRPDRAERAERIREQKIKTLQRKITKLDSRIDRLLVSLAALGWAEEEKGEEEAVAQGPADLMAEPELKIWAHDIDIEPGSTYRYRFTVHLYNPFFGRKPDLVEDQQGLADALTIPSLTGDWSADIEVIPPLKVYVTKAVAGDAGQLGMGQATAEVYRFYHSRWWVETFSIEPGDRVGWDKELRHTDPAAVPKSVDYGTPWFLLDVVGDINPDPQARDRGLGASVLLQRVDNPAVTILVHPRLAEQNPERLKLRELVRWAELTGDLASTREAGPGG